ncbi:uncharacterized protein [Prorops nasuta]|uniref:uncharacterized protein n=1 Tax=Prorops nasuta TaxID=863751 RepID=UPI0034CFCD43
MAYSRVFTVLLLAVIISVAVAKPGYLGGYRYGGYYPYSYSIGYPFYGYGHGHGLYGYGYGHGFGHGLGGYYGHYY